MGKKQLGVGDKVLVGKWLVFVWRNFRFVGEQMMKNVANILTGFRFFCSILLLFFPVFSGAFYSI